MVVQLSLFVGVFITEHLLVMIALWFILGVFCSIRVMVGYVYLIELLPKNSQTLGTTVWCIQECLIILCGVIYFWKISDHWFGLVCIGFCW